MHKGHRRYLPGYRFLRVSVSCVVSHTFLAEFLVRIRNSHLHFLSAGVSVKERVNVGNFAEERFSRHRLCRNFDSLPHVNPRQFILVNIRHDPQTAEVCDAVKIRPFVEVLPLHDVHVNNSPRNRRIERQNGPDFAAVADILYLVFG